MNQGATQQATLGRQGVLPLARVLGQRKESLRLPTMVR